MIQQLTELMQTGLRGHWQSLLSALLLLCVLVYYVVCAVKLWGIDVREHRLPDRIVLPMYVGVGIPLFLIIVLSSENPMAHARETAYSSLIMFGFYGLMRLASKGALGLGDVKLAGVLGLLLGFVSPLTLLWGNVLIFATGGLFVLFLLVTGKAGLRTHIAFGPFMLLGSALALLIPA